MDSSTSSIMPLLQNRGRCVSFEENLDVFLAARDASTEEQDGSVVGKGDTLSHLSSLYRPRRSVSGSSHEHAATAAEDEEMSSVNKRQPSSRVLDEEDEIKMAPPKKMAKKKNQTRITEFYGEGVDDTGYIIHPTHLSFTNLPKAPKKVSRTKRRVLCSVMGCCNTSFHNGGMCFNHGGNRSINPINLFSARQT